MNIENLILCAKALITWGFWIVVYGLVTMLIGAMILIAIAALSNPERKAIR